MQEEEDKRHRIPDPTLAVCDRYHLRRTVEIIMYYSTPSARIPVNATLPAASGQTGKMRQS